eukprot:jgi/Pico_ML_1/52302/g3029.t1
MRAAMRILVSLLALAGAMAAEKDVAELQIGIKHKPETCDRKIEKLDKVSIHYTGKLVDGKVFDSSYKREEPLKFVIGNGAVIQGWDLGLLGACVGEKRKLKIPPHLGYGDTGIGDDIPPKSTLIFDVEVMDIERK